MDNFILSFKWIICEFKLFFLMKLIKYARLKEAINQAN